MQQRSADAYVRLRQAIVTGELRPNERLIETELADELDISRTPVREGLALLAHDGLVMSRRRGWVVRDHSPQEIAEIYEMRAGLEGFAARLAAERAEDASLQAIAAIHHDDGGDAVTSPRQHLVELNDTFHDSIVGATGNVWLAQFVSRSREYFFNYRIAQLYSDDEASASLAGHQRIVDALLARDGDAADRAARDHVLEARTITLSKLR